MQNDAINSLYLRIPIVLREIQRMWWHVYDAIFLLVPEIVVIVHIIVRFGLDIFWYV